MIDHYILRRYIYLYLLILFMWSGNEESENNSVAFSAVLFICFIYSTVCYFQNSVMQNPEVLIEILKKNIKSEKLLFVSYLILSEHKSVIFGTNVNTLALKGWKEYFFVETCFFLLLKSSRPSLLNNHNFINQICSRFAFHW